MIRRVVRDDDFIKAARESRRTARRDIKAGMVLNILQRTNADEARFTVEGEGAEVWCCQQVVIEEHTFPIG